MREHKEEEERLAREKAIKERPVAQHLDITTGGFSFTMTNHYMGQYIPIIKVCLCEQRIREMVGDLGDTECNIIMYLLGR